VSPKHGPRRAQVIFTELALKQIQKLSLPETVAADRAIVALAVNPWLGNLVDETPVREYQEDGVRVFYTTTVLGSVIIVAYLEA
jgi:hypothetical protein